MSLKQKKIRIEARIRLKCKVCIKYPGILSHEHDDLYTYGHVLVGLIVTTRRK